MKKLFYNSLEMPVAVILQSKILGVSKEYQCHTGEGPVWMDELFKLAATNSFEKVEVFLSSNNQAYYRNSQKPFEKIPVDGWISLKEYKNGGGYANDKSITISIKK